MPKRQRVPRYAVVAAEEKMPENSGGRETNNDGNDNTSSAQSRRRSSPGAAPLAVASVSTSASKSISTSSPRASRMRKKNRGKQQQPPVRSLSSSSSRQKQKQSQPTKKRQQQQRQLAAEEILLQLLKACEKHRATCHPDYNPRNASHHSEIPPACESAITSLRMLIPKLETTIASGTKVNGNTKVNSKDVVQLCRFYDNIVRGTYCPHLPHLFGFGTDPQTILDKVLYLLRNSLNVDLDGRDGTTNSEERDTAATATSEYLGVVSRTISGLLASVIDDSSDHIRRKLFVDWIDLSEDIAVVSMMKQQSIGEPTNTDCLPVRLVLFEESSLVTQQRSREQQQRQIGDDEEHNHNDDNSFENYSLDILQWEHVQILQEIALKVLSSLTSNDSSLERLEISPEQQGEEPSVLLGGDMDTFFPSGIVTDIDLVSSLLASLKPAMLISSCSNGLNDNDLGCIDSHQVPATAAEILLRVSLDWHRLGTATIAIPLVPCMIDAAVLITKTVLRVLLGQQQVQRKNHDKSRNRAHEKRLAFLVDSMVCHPPGHDANHSNDGHSIVRTIHSAVWNVLLDCLEGIAVRLRIRRQRKIQEYQEQQVPEVDGSITTTPPSASTSASSIVLDLAVLDTIHFIATTTSSLALEGCNYCAARGIFPHLFLLSSATSLATCQNHDWNDDGSLLRAANQCLGVFIHASSARDANSARLLDDVCLRALERLGGLPKPAILIQPDGGGGLHLDSFEKDTDKVAGNDARTSKKGNHCGIEDNNKDGDGDGDGDDDMRHDRHSLKRKRESLISQQSETSVSTKRKKWFLNEKSGEIVYPLMWYDAFSSFLDFVFNAEETIRDSFATAASQSGECDRFVMGRIIEQIRCLSGGLRLALSLARKLSLTASNRNEYKSISGISRVAHELSMKLASHCDLFLNTINVEDNLETPLSYAMADAILECGLSMHFSKLESRKGLDSSFIEYITHFLDSVSSFSGRLLELGPGRQCDLLSCTKCTGIPAYFSGTRYQDSFESPCCLHLTTHSPNCREQSKEWLFGQSIRTLSSLPLFVRAALLSSLHPVQDNTLSARSDSKSNSLFEYYSLDLFTNFFNRYVEAGKRESSRDVASLLHLLPLMMMSLGDEQPSTGALLIILRKGLNSLIQSLESEDTLIFQSLVFTLGQIHSLVNDKALGFDTRNPTSVFELVVMRHIRLYPIESKKDEISSILRGMMIDVANKGARDDENSISRYFLWMCGANYCISASPSEIRQCSQNTTTGPKGENSGSILSREGVLPWLVAAPFSDPNSLLRKFISPELCTVLMSKECSFLLSRFASSEDFKEYYTYSRSERKDRSHDAMYSLVQMSDDVINGLFEEIDGLLSECCGFSEPQLSLPLGREARSEKEPFGHFRCDTQLSIKQTAAKTLASLCYNAGLDHPIGKTLFEKSTLRLIRMWAAGPANMGETLSFPELQSTPIDRALAFGRLACLSGSRNLPLCLSGEKSWTYFPSASFHDVLILNNGKTRREQYELLERMVHSFFVSSKDSLHKMRSAREASKVVTESIPSTIAQLVNEKDEETIELIIGFNIFLSERSDNLKVVSQTEVHVRGIPELLVEKKKAAALSMGSLQLQKQTKNICLEKVDKILPLVLFHSDQEEALPLKFFTKLTAPATLVDMVANRQQLILKGLAWQLGRDPYRVGPAVRALKTAAEACGKDNLGSDEVIGDMLPGTNAAKLWVTKNFMYLIVNMVQLNWASRKTAQQVQALRCLYELLDFLNSSESPQYFPQVLSTVNAAITVNRAFDVYDPDDSTLRLHAVQCLSKFVRLSAEENIESVMDNLTTIVVSLLPILEEDGVDEDGVLNQEARIEAVSMLEFLTRAEFVRNFPKAFSQIPFLPTSTSLGNVHKSLRDNGINFDNLLILSTSTSESQAGANSRRESLTSENTINSTSSTLSISGDNVLALQNRISLVSSLLYDENASVRNVALQHLVDLLRANRNLFHILVENEGGSLVKNYLTLVYERVQNGSSNKKQVHSKTATSVTVSNIIEKLMQRCVKETDQRVRLQLAICLGEIGAIGEHRLDDMSLFRSKGNGSMSMYEWRLDQPPWQSRAAKYELQLVTKYLVAALRAAPSQEEQLKIAFTIQQLLMLLDASVRENNNTEPTDQHSNSQKREMSKWLLDRLVEANVYDLVEPFWLSQFSTKDERYRTRQPPFFNTSNSYHIWISEFCRWMILKTKDCPLSRWKDFFFACRIAVRSLAGLETAEFILPLLVLDRICFGSVEEFESICQEFLRILDFDSDSSLMDSSERQKAVGGFFAMIDTLEYWAEVEAEQRYRSKHSSTSKRSSKGYARQNSNSRENENSLSNWPADDTITQIEELISRIPLIDQARAATKVGMHAKGLRLLELVARKNVVEEFFESSSDDKTGEISTSGNLFQQCLLKNANAELMKSILSNLNDCETLNVIGETSYLVNPLLQVADSIQWKEASGNYEGALRDYERAIQVRRVDNSYAESSIEKGALDCMLKLGRFESVLSRVLTEDRNIDNVSTKAFAIEAASHLGQWDKLSNLVEENETNDINFCPDDAYRQATGKAVLCLRDHDWLSIGASFRTARTAVMDNLSSVARESYSKAYTDIARLQCIRELEDAAALFCTGDGGDVCSLSDIVESTLHEGWAWEGRLKLTTPRAASTIMNTRVAIARLGSDPLMESSLLLDIGKQAFHNGMPTVAEKFYSKAEAALSLIPVYQNERNQKIDSLLDDVRVQYAKLKKGSGENILALKILGQGMVQDALFEMNRNNEDIELLKKIAVKHERLRAEKNYGKTISVGNDRKLIDRFANRLLRLTQWTVEGGMQSGNEIMERFQTVIRLSPEWEKGHFQFAKYLNDLVTRFFEKDSPHGMEEDVIRFNALYRDNVCHQYILLAIEHYATTLKLDMKHVYQALPRLLSLWFDFVSVQPPSSDDNVPPGALKPEYRDFLAENQNKANLLMADNTKAIPAAAYYTAMPQLISRVIHNNEDTAKVVKRILERVLTKFPPQAMWHLAWLKGSKNDERSKIGADIFKGAQRVLIKNRQTNVANLLKASDSLFKFLQDLARYNPKGKSHSSVVSVKSWKGIADLSEFIPPVQAALSISPFKPIKSSSKEYFPRVIPRMRAFSSKVTVMHSKAKPKKIKAFAVPGTWKHANVAESNNGDGRTSSSTPLDCDIGEIHFLVKQEAKGDLRKDARVQDLNNVINRLMASSNNSNSTLSSKSRRLRVRTFAVTCLSEDTGIIEWVPDTDSLRNLVSRSYNPQVSSFCPRRRGSRMTNFGDPTLRSSYERAQNQFMKNGDLAQAAKLYYLLCLKQCPPVLSWWFVQHFRSATDWYEARKKFTLTAAAWSAIGHVIGLGDRHSENILVETKTGRVVHVDFDCIFDKGLNLPRPEVVPFRLTPNMLDAFGPTGADGMFSSGMESSLEILRDNRETLLSVLEPFIKDPVIDWKRHRTQQNVSSAIGSSNDSRGEAKRSIRVIKERLSGICNLRNPNYRKLRNVIPQGIRNRVEQDNMMKEILPLSVEGQVQKLCTEASKNENLVQLYVGWMPWI